MTAPCQLSQAYPAIDFIGWGEQSEPQHHQRCIPEKTVGKRMKFPVAFSSQIAIIASNNTRHASPDLGPSCAPRRVTFFQGGLS